MQNRKTQINVKDRKHTSKLTVLKNFSMPASGVTREKRGFQVTQSWCRGKAGKGSEAAPISLSVVSPAGKLFGFLYAALVRVKSHSA